MKQQHRWTPFRSWIGIVNDDARVCSSRRLRPPSEKDTLHHSNVVMVAAKQQQHLNRAASIRDQLRQSLAAAAATRRSSFQKPLRRTQSDTDEVQLALKHAQMDRLFSHHGYHRRA